MKELVMTMVQGLISAPEKARVEEVREDGIVSITLLLDPDDMGKAIGKKGRIANAMRQVLKACAIKEDVKVNLEIRALDE